MKVPVLAVILLGMARSIVMPDSSVRGGLIAIPFEGGPGSIGLSASPDEGEAEGVLVPDRASVSDDRAAEHVSGCKEGWAGKAVLAGNVDAMSEYAEKKSPDASLPEHARKKLLNREEPGGCHRRSSLRSSSCKRKGEEKEKRRCLQEAIECYHDLEHGL